MNDKPLVLIVDDEPQIRRLLTVTLEANAYRVLSAVCGQEGLVLRAMSRRVVVPQEVPGSLRIGRRPGNRVELMVAEDAVGAACFDHAAHQCNGGGLFGAAIDQIPDEDRAPLGVAPHPASEPVSQVSEKIEQTVILTVDIADHVERGAHECTS